MKPPIKIFLDSNEIASRRAKALRSIIDHRFDVIQPAELPFDLQFISQVSVPCQDRPEVHTFPILNVELKEPADYVSSVFSGHLYQQSLSMRELGAACAILITGEWADVMQASRDSCIKRGAKDQIASSYLRLKSFRKRALLQGIHVFYQGDDSGFFDSDNVYKDLLELVADLFTDGSLIGFRPRPADNERQVVALCYALKIGPKTAASLLTEFGSFREAIGWMDLSSESCCERLKEIPGIGPKTIEGMRKAMA